MINPRADVDYAVLVLAAEDMYAAQGAHVLEPVVDPRISANWDLRGYIIGTDAILRLLNGWALGEQRVYYGLLLESRSAPGHFAAAIRGTSGWQEWGEDLEGMPKMGRWPGRVESGFQGVYDSFAYKPVDASEIPMIGAISTIVGSGTLTVAGHSLGSALATYLAYELSSALPGRVSLRIWASPHSGDSGFCAAVAAALPDHAHYRNFNDFVPRVPIALGYAHIPNTVLVGPITDKIEVKNDWGHSHHLISYIALMAPDLYESAASARDQPYLDGIIKRIPTT